MNFRKFLLLLTAALFLAGCTPKQQHSAVPTQTGSGIQVITSISPLADLIKNVGGDKIKVTALIKPGNDPHDYEPRPDDVKLVAGAQVFFANGAGEEPYLEKLIKNAGSASLKTVTLSDGLELLEKGGEGEYSSTGNPHLWLDVSNAEAYVEKIRNTLSQISPQDKDYFSANADRYLKELDNLDNSISTQISAIPLSNRKMVVFHDAFPYFAKRYGLQFRSLVKSSDSEPSAKQYAELITYVKQEQVKAIFGEAGFNPKLVKQLSQATGTTFVDNLYDDTVSPNTQADTYIKMMELNTKTIVQALK